MRGRLHHEAMRLLSDSDEAEDITQEVVIKLWTMRDRLDEYRSVEALAMVMARRLSLNRLRNAAVPLEDWRAHGMESGSTPEAELISKENVRRIERLMDTLPDTQQAILRMKHIDGMEVAEIARMTGCTEEAVRQNLSRARRRIMRHFITEQI